MNGVPQTGQWETSRKDCTINAVGRKQPVFPFFVVSQFVINWAVIIGPRRGIKESFSYAPWLAIRKQFTCGIQVEGFVDSGSSNCLGRANSDEKQGARSVL